MQIFRRAKIEIKRARSLDSLVQRRNANKHAFVILTYLNQTKQRWNERRKKIPTRKWSIETKQSNAKHNERKKTIRLPSRFVDDSSAALRVKIFLLCL